MNISHAQGQEVQVTLLYDAAGTRTSLCVGSVSLSTKKKKKFFYVKKKKNLFRRKRSSPRHFVVAISQDPKKKQQNPLTSASNF